MQIGQTVWAKACPRDAQHALKIVYIGTDYVIAANKYGVEGRFKLDEIQL